MPLKPHERILEAATRLFVEEGVRGAGMNRIAAEAGVAPMTIYRQFGGKERLVAAVVEDWSARSLQWLAERLHPSREVPRSSLEDLWDMLETWLAGDELQASLLAWVATDLRGRPDHPAHKAIEAHRLAMRDLLEDLARRAGAVDPPRDARQLLLLLEVSVVVGTWPTGADDVRALAGAALEAASAR